MSVALSCTTYEITGHFRLLIVYHLFHKHKDIKLFIHEESHNEVKNHVGDVDLRALSPKSMGSWCCGGNFTLRSHVGLNLPSSGFMRRIRMLTRELGMRNIRGSRDGLRGRSSCRHHLHKKHGFIIDRFRFKVNGSVLTPPHLQTAESWTAAAPTERHNYRPPPHTSSPAIFCDANEHIGPAAAVTSQASRAIESCRDNSIGEKCSSRTTIGTLAHYLQRPTRKIDEMRFPKRGCRCNWCESIKQGPDTFDILLRIRCVTSAWRCKPNVYNGALPLTRRGGARFASDPHRSEHPKAIAAGFGDSSSMLPVSTLKEKKIPSAGSIRSLGKIPWKRMIFSLPVWAIVVNNFTFHYALYVLMNWLPTYFELGLQLSLQEMGSSKMMPYLNMFIFSNIGGVLADYLITRRIFSVTRTRKLLNTIGFIVAAVALMALPSFRNPTGTVLCSSVSLGFLALGRAGFAVNHMDVAPRYAGIVMGISNTAGTLAGIVGVGLTGRILEAAKTDDMDLSSSESWRSVFFIPGFGVMDYLDIQRLVDIRFDKELRKGCCPQFRAATSNLAERAACKPSGQDDCLQPSNLRSSMAKGCLQRFSRGSSWSKGCL
ncbi:hypothetical protein OPV22_030848 [Ensete ventricosum]|uniref:Major facilitator superfamily (MFS) profile domain-containing protein n=1 Tax=Ensete ventricosum TaxID=4639 RepID=A0AAV8PK12_ENSVE|nr:hypothetical protein OPV22_030848 [Ensete ventricosum]